MIRRKRCASQLRILPANGSYGKGRLAPNMRYEKSAHKGASSQVAGVGFEPTTFRL